MTLLDDENRPSKSILPRLFPLLVNDLDDAANFDEIVDSAGRTLTDFASVLLKQIFHALAAPKSAYTVAGIGAVMSFLEMQGAPYDPHDILRLALLSRGVIPSLVSSLRALEDIKTEMTEFTIAICSALGAGLLHCIISFATRPLTMEFTTKEAYPRLKDLVSVILPGSLVSYSVPPIYEDWKTLATVVQSRIKILDEWEAADRESLGACDNMKRARAPVIALVNVRSSTGGMHIGMFAIPRICYSHQLMHSRERAFMRALLQKDYLRLWYTLSIRILSFLVEHPGDLFFICFDYTTAGGVTAQVVPKDVFKAVRNYEAELPVQWGRSARAEGRMELHVAFVNVGDNERPLLLPLRATSSKFHDGLRRLAAEVPPGGDIKDYFLRLDPKLRDLIREVYDEVIEIH
ncbi:hypothetical protein FB451DRAFT_1532032 [Mycena latifolia]|nr:hypothetical protein FB451DRAFT_1532032 [Mycena latifolia]